MSIFLLVFSRTRFPPWNNFLLPSETAHMFLLKRTAAGSTHCLSFWSGMWAGSTLRQSHACVQCQAMPGQLTACGMLVWDSKIQRDSSTDLFMIQLLKDGIWATSGIFMKTRQKRFSKDWHQRSWGSRAWVQEWKSSGTDKSDLKKKLFFLYANLLSALQLTWFLAPQHR